MEEQNPGQGITEYSIIQSEGKTLESRFATPEGYVRVSAETGSLAEFLRGYALKEDGAPILLYNGEEKGNQSAHAAVFTIPMLMET